jgi:hypothetical protein
MTVISRVFALAIVLAAVFGAAAWGYAQGSAAPRGLNPTVLSGADIGFEVTGTRKGRPVGRLVVRIDGEWKEVQFAHAVTPLR